MAHQAEFPIATMCRVLGASTGGFYAWQKRAPPRRADAEPAADLVQRQFSAARSNELWVADITYIPTRAGFIFLAVVLDAFSRRAMGWAMPNHLRTELVHSALWVAIEQRRPKDVIFHSDHGTQYTAVAFELRCKQAGIRVSRGSAGDCYDNALCESFFATLECELLDRQSFRNGDEAKTAVFEFIEGLYNPRRRHSSLGYLSPIDYERTFTTQPTNRNRYLSTKSG